MDNKQGPPEWSFDAAYTGIPPWDIGHPQQVYVDLAQTGQIQGSVLDVGCGTGEHTLYPTFRSLKNAISDINCCIYYMFYCSLDRRINTTIEWHFVKTPFIGRAKHVLHA